MTKRLVLVLSLVVLMGAGDALGELVGWWKLDEGGGTKALDSSGKGNDGTIVNKPTWIDGVNGGALEFHGLGRSGGGGDYINCGTKAILDVRGPISIAIWLKPGADDPEGKATETAPMAKADSVAGWSWQLRYGWGASKPFMGFQFEASPSTVWVFVNQKLVRDEWCHVACSHDGKTVKCFLNGTQTDSAAMTTILGETGSPILIGSDGWGCDWIGAIDDARLYNHGLSEAEIQAAMSVEPILTAYSPSPRNGEMLIVTKTTLKWQPGDKATAHEVYFGESFEQVSAATTADTAVFLGRQTTAELAIGAAGNLIPTALVPGKTYYWRIDEINGEQVLKGNVWSFWIQPVTAWKPFPADGMKYVDPNQDLSWELGMGAVYHTIYFGRTFDEVSAATAGGAPSIAASFDPDTLALDTTYYWRVDEFQYVLPTPITHKGPVWSFTTRGAGGGAKAQYFKSMDLSGAPVLTRIEGTINVDATGEVVAGLSDNLSARWTANLEVPFTETYRLITTTDDGVKLWLDGRLIIDNWTDHGTTDDSALVSLAAGQVYSLRMEWYENTVGAVAQLSWESATLPRAILPQGWLQLPVRAAGPYPANAAVDAPQTPMLRWIAGEKAASQELYFGEDKDAVTTGTTPTARLGAADTTYDPGALQWGKTYYWRVDEVNAADAESPWKGVTWSFTTADFLLVDDFESYTNEVGERVFQTWLDGYGYTEPKEVQGNGTNALVGYDPSAGDIMETTIVHGGGQSMPMDYNNVISPYKSEAERTWSTPQNWTVNGMNTLVLFVRGTGGNGVDQLYVAVQDNANHVGVINHPDAAAVKATKWLEWKIPLSQLTSAGVSVTTVKTMYIGVGDRTSPKAGGAGTLYIDDIRVIKSP